MWEYLDKNKEWIFSGIGASIVIFILTFVFTYFRKRNKRANSKNIASDNSSINNIKGKKVNFSQTIVNNLSDFVKEQNNKSVSITFHDDLKEIICEPKFKRKGKVYKFKQNENGLSDIQQLIKNTFPYTHSDPLEKRYNLSYSKIYLKIHNTGIDPIEEYKIFFQFEGELQDLSNSNEKCTIPKFGSNTYLSKDLMRGQIIPKKNILVGDDILCSDDIFLKPFPKETKVILKWKLISKNFKDEGELVINFIPDIVLDLELIADEKSPELRIEEEQEIEDYFADKITASGFGYIE